MRNGGDTVYLRPFEKKHREPTFTWGPLCFMYTVHGVRFQHETAIFNPEMFRSKLQKNEVEINAEPERCEGHFL